MSITKRVALITGSAQGIGRGIALRLARDGFNIALNDIPSKYDQLRVVANDIDKMGRKSILIPADVTVEVEVKGMVQEVAKGLGRLDVMVANAGTTGGVAPLASTGLDTWERVMTVNARGPFLCYKYAAQQMIKQGHGGRIIGASSAAGKQGYPLAAPYTASKWAIRGLTQTAALELGKYGITVNSYAPGLINTPMTRDLDPLAPPAEDKESASWISTTITRRPIKVDGQPEHIASLVSYLASEEAHFITGQCVGPSTWLDRIGMLNDLDTDFRGWRNTHVLNDRRNVVTGVHLSLALEFNQFLFGI